MQLIAKKPKTFAEWQRVILEVEIKNDNKSLQAIIDKKASSSQINDCKKCFLLGSQEHMQEDGLSKIKIQQLLSLQAAGWIKE